MTRSARVLVAALTFALTAGGSDAQTPPESSCNPRAAAVNPRSITRAFDVRTLHGSWQLTLSVRGPFIADTVITGPMHLLPRVGPGVDSVMMRISPMIGWSDIELEFLSGMPAFRTFVGSRDLNMPGIESRRDDSGYPIFVLGNPTETGVYPIRLTPGASATLTVLHGDATSFSGSWSLDTFDANRPQGWFCARRT